MSNSFTKSGTFNVTHAKKLAAKIATDLKRIQRMYGKPDDKMIDDYENELIALLKDGYFKEATYGFKKDGKFIEPTIKYTEQELSSSGVSDDDPGKIRPGANIEGATFGSFLEHSLKWFMLTDTERSHIEEGLPIKRSHMASPAIDGYYEQDKTYSAGNKALDRSSLRKA